MNHAEQYLLEASRISLALDASEIERMASDLAALRDRPNPRRLYVAGLGGSAANAAHAAADFRKLCHIEAASMAALVPELTAWSNDEGWAKAYQGALSFGRPGDALLVLSVGGGADGVSLPLIEAVKTSKLLGMKVFGIVGRDGGYVAANADRVILIPNIEPERVTPHAEAFQMVVIHCLVSHPALQMRRTKW